MDLTAIPMEGVPVNLIGRVIGAVTAHQDTVTYLVLKVVGLMLISVWVEFLN